MAYRDYRTVSVGTTVGIVVPESSKIPVGKWSLVPPRGGNRYRIS
jgi:hypothetical protein